jgi:hypothetical protein
MPVAGVIREGSNPLVVDTRAGPMVATETEGLVLGKQPQGLIDTIEDRFEFRYPDEPDGDRYVQGPYSARGVNCPGLLQGGHAALPNMSCENGTLKLHNAFRDTAWLAPPAGYEIAHLSRADRVLLRRTATRELFRGTVSSTGIQLDPVRIASNVDAETRILFESSTSLGYFSIFADANRYWVRNTDFGPEINLSFPTEGVPEPGTQCGGIGIFDPAMQTVERVNGQRIFKRYRVGDTATLVNAVVVGDSEDYFCVKSIQETAVNQLTPYRLTRSDDGDELRSVFSDGLLYKANDPVLGIGRIHRSGRTLFVQFPDQIIRRLSAPLRHQPLEYRSRNVPYALSAGQKAFSPLYEYFLEYQASSGRLRLMENRRNAFDGTLITQRAFLVPAAIQPADIGLPLVNVLTQDPDGAARAVTFSTPDGAQVYGLDRAQLQLRQYAYPPQVTGFRWVRGSGDRVLAVGARSDSEFLMTRWDGEALSFAPAPLHELPGWQANLMSDGYVLIRAVVDGRLRLLAHDGVQPRWMRDFSADCRYLENPDHVLVDCPQTTPVSLSRLQGLSDLSGETRWSRLITPLNVTEGFRAQFSWTEAERLRVVGSAGDGNVLQRNRLSVASLNAQTGQLLQMSPSRELSTAGLISNGMNFDQRFQLPLGQQAIQLRRILRFGVLDPSSYTERFMLRTDILGRLVVNPLTISLVANPDFFTYSELPLRLLGNEGMLRFSVDAVGYRQATRARGPESEFLAQPLTTRVDTYTLPSADEARRGIQFTVSNPNPVLALEARLRTPLLCPGTNAIDGEISFNVAPNASAVFNCTMLVPPVRGLTARAAFELRQPRNFDGVGFGWSGAPLEVVQLLLKDGFD